MENETFWISFISITSGLIVLALKLCLKSKCDVVTIGCIKVHRNTEQEQDVEIGRNESSIRM